MKSIPAENDWITKGLYNLQVGEFGEPGPRCHRGGRTEGVEGCRAVVGTAQVIHGREHRVVGGVNVATRWASCWNSPSFYSARQARRASSSTTRASGRSRKMICRRSTEWSKSPRNCRAKSPSEATVRATARLQQYSPYFLGHGRHPSWLLYFYVVASSLRHIISPSKA